MKRASSMPVRPAMRACSALTVGSSPNTSSPTSAAAIAARIAGVGFVTVSLRKSGMAGLGSGSVGGARRARSAVGGELQRELDRGEQAAGVGDAAAREVERGAVVDRGAHE